MTWNEIRREHEQSNRCHNMADRQTAIAHKHVAALSALKVYPGHMPLDGQCLEEMTHMGLIRPVRDGFCLTPRGEETLEEEIAGLQMRRSLYATA